MQFSKFGEKLAGNTGIFQLMDDFSASLNSEQPMQMLGGGNPSHIPEVLECFRQALLALINDPHRFAAFLGNYDAPQGNFEFISALATMLRDQCGWDVTEENIQPRIRGMYLMALSNKHHALLLATGNKSELSVGYCTLYGDMCGGLAVTGTRLRCMAR